MKTIEVQNISTFEPDVGAGKLLGRREVAKVEDTETIRSLIDDGHLRLVEKAAKSKPTTDAKPATETPASGENGGTE